MISSPFDARHVSEVWRTDLVAALYGALSVAYHLRQIAEEHTWPVWRWTISRMLPEESQYPCHSDARWDDKAGADIQLSPPAFIALAERRVSERVKYYSRR